METSAIYSIYCSVVFYIYFVSVLWSVGEWWIYETQFSSSHESHEASKPSCISAPAIQVDCKTEEAVSVLWKELRTKFKVVTKDVETQKSSDGLDAKQVCILCVLKIVREWWTYKHI